MATASKRDGESKKKKEEEKEGGTRERVLYKRMKRPFSVCLPVAPRGELLEKCDFSHQHLRGNSRRRKREMERIWNERQAANY